MKTKFIIGLLMVMTLAFSSCKKDDDSGYQPKGTYGNTNIKTDMLSATSWTWDNVNYWRWALFNVSNITSSVVNGGAVMLYQSTGSGYYVALPITQNVTGTIREHDWFEYHQGQIAIYIEHSDLSDPNPPAFTYKLICISPAARIAHPEVDLKNYQQVKAVFNLKD